MGPYPARTRRCRQRNFIIEYPNQDLTGSIIGAFFHVYRALGSGFRECVYERALKLGLEDRGLKAQREVPLRVWYGGCF